MKVFKKAPIKINKFILLFFLSLSLAFLSLMTPDKGVLRSSVLLMFFSTAFSLNILLLKFVVYRAVGAAYFVGLSSSLLIYFTLSIFKSTPIGWSGVMFWYFSGIFAVAIYYNYNKVGEVYSKFLFIVVLLASLLYIFGLSPEEYLPGSRNSFSYYLVPLVAVLFILNYLHNIKVSSFVVFAVLFLCIVSHGRSGIVTSFILFFAWFLEEYRIKSFSSKFAIVIGASSAVVAALIIGYKLGFLDYLLSKGVDAGHRIYIIESYIKGLDVVSSIIGADLLKIPNLEDYNYNLHNTYLYVHYRFGIFAIVLYLGLVFSLLAFFRVRHLYIMLAIGAVVFRFFTDSGLWLNFIGLHMVLILALSRYRVATRVGNGMRYSA